MTLVVNGSQQDRATIEGWLREICGPVSVDPNTGVVSVTHPPPYTPYNYTTGCDCLNNIISSGHPVVITPLPGPDADIPNSGKPAQGGQPAIPNRKIGEARGASTGYSPTGLQNPDGSPGTGSGARLHIDMSNNAGRGYDYPAQGGNPAIPSPMWVILAHELTTGHASHAVAGTAARDSAGREAQAIASETPHRERHGLPARPLSAY